MMPSEMHSSNWPLPHHRFHRQDSLPASKLSGWRVCHPYRAQESSMKQKAAFLSACLLAVTLSAGVGCAKKPDDAQISKDIQNRFSQDSGLSSKQLTVQADAGVVTLSGNVDNDAQRDAARRQAASVPG